jgi:hypothetical protein
MIKPRYTLRRAGATNTPAQGIALANALRPFFVGPPANGGAGAASYLHTQSVASATWTVNHNLGREPVIQVLTAGGVEMEAAIVHVSSNQAQVNFASPQTGRVRAI